MFETALQPGEIITAVSFPVPLARGYEKFRSPASRYALVGVFVAQTQAGVRVAVTGAAPCVFRAKTIEAALTEKFAPEALASIRIAADGLNSDMHGDAEYRAHLIGVLARRAVEKVLATRREALMTRHRQRARSRAPKIGELARLSAAELLEGYPQDALHALRTSIDEVIDALAETDEICNVMVTPMFDSARAAASGGDQGVAQRQPARDRSPACRSR